MEEIAAASAPLPKSDAKSKFKKKKGGGFQCMNLLPAVYQAIRAKGYNLPTPIQRKTIPKILSGQNVVATSRTGMSSPIRWYEPNI